MTGAVIVAGSSMKTLAIASQNGYVLGKVRQSDLMTHWRDIDVLVKTGHPFFSVRSSDLPMLDGILPKKRYDSKLSPKSK